jgi:hypothetical protein
MTHKNGCFDRPPFKPHYLPTGAPDTPEYRIPHVWGQSCEYRHSNLGKTDPGCTNCKHKESKK